MRGLADAERIRRFMEALGEGERADGRVYFTGGATAVLFGWRASTIGIDVKVAPEQDALLRAIPRLKERLQINVELAAPIDFIPVRGGWEDRSPFIERIRKLSFHHFDLYAQALVKVERGHAQDVEDVEAMVARKLVDPRQAIAYFEAIEPELYRYPAIDPAAFREAVEATFLNRSS